MAARAKKKEAVNHPQHYGGDTIYETIKVQEAKLTHDEFVGAMKFQVAKYLDRSGKKAAAILEDWRKAQFYLNYMIDYETRYVVGMTGEGRVDTLVLARVRNGRAR